MTLNFLDCRGLQVCNALLGSSSPAFRQLDCPMLLRRLLRLSRQLRPMAAEHFSIYTDSKERAASLVSFILNAGLFHRSLHCVPSVGACCWCLLLRT